MRISITGRHTTVTDALKQYAQEKIGRLDRYFDGIQDISVVLSIEDHQQKAECILHVVKGGAIVAESDGDDLYAAIDRVMEKMERRIKRYKGKLRGPKHKDSGKRDSGLFAAITPDDEERQDFEDDEGAV